MKEKWLHMQKQGSIIERVLQSVSSYATRIALTDHDKKSVLNYSRVGQLMECYSNNLISVCNNYQRSIENGFVVVQMRPSTDAILLQLAVLFCNAIYVPIDPDTPLSYFALERLDGIACIITDSENLPHYPGVPVIYVADICNEDTCNDDESYLNEKQSIQEHSHCIMTSGTTGIPKAISLRQQSVLNQVDAKISILRLNQDSVICLSMSVSFVASIWQVFGTLFVGGTIVVLNDECRRSPYDIFKIATVHEATIMCTTPSVLKAFLALNRGTRKLPLDSLLAIVSTGETLSSVLVRDFYLEYDITIVNAYGQTECSDDTFHYIVPRNFDFDSNSVIPIGYPIPNIEYCILNKDGNVADEGELFISGICLSDGYLKDDNMTALKYKAIRALGNKIAFGTGDIVERNRNGAIVCNGRVDNQIKLSGYRIDPEMVESHCLAIEGISDTLVLKHDSSIGAHLVLLYTSEDGCEVDEIQIREHLKNRLPAYMVPEEYRVVDKIDYNTNGKKIRDSKYG